MPSDSVDFTYQTLYLLGWIIVIVIGILIADWLVDRK